MTAIVVAILNALGALLPQLPGFIAEIRASSDLTDGGKAALDLIDSRLTAAEKRVDAIKPLAVPESGD